MPVSDAMNTLRDAILSGKAGPEDYVGLPLPESMLAIATHRDEVTMFEGLESHEKDPRRSLHLDEVPVPEVGPNEPLVAVMAYRTDFNTLWSSVFDQVAHFH